MIPGGAGHPCSSKKKMHHMTLEVESARAMSSASVEDLEEDFCLVERQ
jgi:hypothetical protein